MPSGPGGCGCRWRRSKLPISSIASNSRCATRRLAIDYGVGNLLSPPRRPWCKRTELSHEGTFPIAKSNFLLGLNAFQGPRPARVPVALTIRDADDNIVQNRQSGGAASRQAASSTGSTSRPTRRPPIGPFTLEVGIDSEAHAISFNASLRFAQPNALVPISSLEHGEAGLWFARRRSRSCYRIAGIVLFAAPARPGPAQLSAGQLTTRPRNTPAPVAASIEYRGRQARYVWSRQELPGKPLATSFWVKGNESHDELGDVLRRPHQFRPPGLDAERQFLASGDLHARFRRLAAILGAGAGGRLAGQGSKGSTANIDGPVKLLALVIKPGPPLPKRPASPTPGRPRRARTVWVDDLAVETQILPADQLLMELDPARLTAS